MATIASPNLISLKITLDKGADLNGDRIIAYKTYGSINFESSVTKEKLMTFVNGIVGLQQHTKTDVKVYRSYSLSR